MMSVSPWGHGGDDGFRSRGLYLDGVALSRLSYITMFLRSGGWGRTSVSGLTVRRPAIERRQNENAALCRPLPVLARDVPSWRGADLNRYFPAYETGVLPLDDRAATLDGSDPSSPA